MNEQLTPLTIHESAEFVRVAFNNDPDDWITEYRKDGNFPARRWAERMVMLHAQRGAEQHQMVAPNG